MDRSGRQAARDARHGGDEARARELRERLRMGTLTAERLRLAAGLGHPAARLALDHRAVDEPDLADRIEELTYGLSKAGLVRVALALVRPALRRWEAEHVQEDGPRGVVEALEAWLASPSAKRAAAAHRAARAVWAGPPLLMGQPVNEEHPSPVERALHAVATAGRVAAAAPPFDRAEVASAALYATEAAGEQVVWHALKAELLAWALPG